MKIKEAEELTGLSAKTIRFYESEGLIHVKRSSNRYREYDDENIKSLKEIKVLRNLNIAISKIKDLNEGKTSLKDILESEIKSLNKSEVDTLLKKSTIEVILKDIDKNKSVNLIEYYNDIEEIQSDEFTELITDLNELGKSSLSQQILLTLIFGAPILHFFSNIGNVENKTMTINGILLIISTVILTLMWRKYLKQPNKKVKGSGLMLISVIITIILILAAFVGLSAIQKRMLVPKDYIMFILRPPYTYLFFIFEIEVLVFFVSNLYKKIKNIEWRWAADLSEFIRRNIVLAISINIILLYVCITGITVITKDKIIDHSFYNPVGNSYSYDEISKVETGFKGKLFNKFDRGAGEFYYKITLKNGKEINLYQSNSPYEDTYLELEIFDKLIMDKGKAKKISSKDNYNLCDLDKRYVDRFLRIVENY